MNENTNTTLTNLFDDRNATTTLSVYAFTVTVKAWNDEKEAVEKVSATYYAPKQLSDNIVKTTFENAGYTVVGKVETVVSEKQGLYELSWKTFAEHGLRVGDTRPKKEKTEK